LLIVSPLLLIGFGIALVAAGKWFARNDAVWLSRVIEGALGGSQQPGEGPLSVGVADSGAVPTPLKCTALFFTILGLLSLVARLVPAPATNINAGMDQVLATRPLGGLNYAVGVACIVLAVGIWARRPWAWWAVFVVIAAAYVQPLFTVFRDIRVSPPIAFQVIFCVVGLAISVIWGLWWYAQRKHFLWE